MTDLTTIIPCNPAGDILDKLYSDRYRPRTRLGLSEIGHECSRYLFYKSHGYAGAQPEGQTLRLFELGNVLESHIIEDLESAGFKIDGRQSVIRFESGTHKLEGHSDGIITGPPPFSKPHLLEIKTAADKGFKDYKKNGYQDWNPKYKGQIHAYMSGIGLSRCLCVVYNKNTSEIYSERIRIDREYADEIVKRAFWAMEQNNPPPRACPKADYYFAKWCDYREECFK